MLACGVGRSTSKAQRIGRRQSRMDQNTKGLEPSVVLREENEVLSAVLTNGKSSAQPEPVPRELKGRRNGSRRRSLAAHGAAADSPGGGAAGLPAGEVARGRRGQLPHHLLLPVRRGAPLLASSLQGVAPSLATCAVSIARKSSLRLPNS